MRLCLHTCQLEKTHTHLKNTANTYVHETKFFFFFPYFSVVVAFWTTTSMRCQVVVQNIHQTFEEPVTKTFGRIHRAPFTSQGNPNKVQHLC